jgi:hypothetical protein
MPRKVLIHYHLFKNAGTSVDAILRRNFGAGWISKEFRPPRLINHQDAIRELILDHPNVTAISSHTLTLPQPTIDGVEIFPILFVRHPLDRLKSAYEFERKQQATTVGSKFAKELDFAGYLQARLAIPRDYSCRNFQAHRLAMAIPQAEATEAERALLAAARLPFVGLVEAFEASALRLQERLRPMLPAFESFDIKLNVTAALPAALEERLRRIREELGEECFASTMAANQADMSLYEAVVADYARESTSAEGLQPA